MAGTAKLIRESTGAAFKGSVKQARNLGAGVKEASKVAKQAGAAAKNASQYQSRIARYLKDGKFAGNAQGAKLLMGAGNAEIAKNFAEAGGWKTVAQSAGRSALGGAVVGATINTAQGEDPWEGAAKGAITGGLGGASIRASRMGMGVPKGGSFVDSAQAFNQKHRYSQSVQTLMKGAENNQMAKSFMKQK